MKLSSCVNSLGQHPSSSLDVRMEGQDRLKTFTLLCKLFAKCILVGGGGAHLCDFYETSTIGF